MASDVTGDTSMQFGTTWKTGILVTRFREKDSDGVDFTHVHNRGRDMNWATDNKWSVYWSGVVFLAFVGDGAGPESLQTKRHPADCPVPAAPRCDPPREG
jgi:hypothetical protein